MAWANRGPIWGFSADGPPICSTSSQLPSIRFDSLTRRTHDGPLRVRESPGQGVK